VRGITVHREGAGCRSTRRRRPAVFPADAKRGGAARGGRCARRAVARRTEVALQVAAITLFWVVSLALLIGWGMIGTAGAERDVAALLAVVAPFAAAVIATRHGYVWVGGAYVLLTLVMVVPAVGIAGLG
jgi:hypothetical protein